MKHIRDGPDSSLDQATWQQILTVAQERFLAKGYKSVSMKEIADAVQVTQAAVYYHFPKGKEDLFTRMIQALFARLALADQDQATSTTQGLREHMLQLTTELLTLPLDQLPWLLRDAKEHLKDPNNLQIVLSLHKQIKQRVMDLFQAAREAGEIRMDLSIDVLVRVYLGVLKEARNSKKPQEASQLVTVLLDGMAGSTLKEGIS
jgi:TetR/AcrR family transcriptional regulator, cholesterol catabolism regulator